MTSEHAETDKITKDTVDGMIAKLETLASLWDEPDLSVNHHAGLLLTQLWRKLERIRTHWEACVSGDSERDVDWMKKMREILDD